VKQRQRDLGDVKKDMVVLWKDFAHFGLGLLSSADDKSSVQDERGCQESRRGGEEQQPLSRSCGCLRHLSRVRIYSADAVSGVAAPRCQLTLAPRQTSL
jgi:hypothetical protein